MSLLGLPDLCLVRVAAFLCEMDPLWQATEVVGDVIALAATCHATRAFVVPHMVGLIDPPNEYDLLVSCWTGVRPATVATLKDACSKYRLRVSGTASELRERLRAALVRSPSTGLSAKFVENLQRRGEKLGRSDLDQIHLLEDAMGVPHSLSRDVGPRMSRRRFLRQVQLGTGRTLAVLLDLKAKADAARREVQMQRRVELINALAARGCALRDDSQLCKAYITSGVGSLERVVDATEDITFFCEHTRYTDHLRALRGASRLSWSNFDREFDRAFGSCEYWRRRERYRDGIEEDDYDSSDGGWEDEKDEETLRMRAKAIALEEWMKCLQVSPTSSNLLPRSLHRLLIHHFLLQS